ncbi:von Willebrand factor type A domain-containing protein [Butyrivibrio sp. DSM 10294]|uniref:vWA domain-containing protein n=1 Tax=Butyrivibrio sp. DSM 10294 TaxID=2972457 RepID=UPI00234E4EBB|nr:von Willebrand factor type A domain-containing protein [Butyrivibrio sp. DSM 10294]MDC7293741.1 von Willebrand factor type A domain-containing protein [Butyrivibrio sp. DSM 10294]
MKRYIKGLSLLTTITIMAASLTGCGGANRAAQEASPMPTSDTQATEAPAAEAPIAKSEQASPSPSHEAATEECESYEAAPMAPAAGYESANKAVTESYGDYDERYNNINPGESYEKPEEAGFFLTQTQPLSTFAADVDTASYANVRRMIEDGYDLYDINGDAVREEEFLNYFDYNLVSPKAGNKFGVTAEISTCPWNSEHELLFVGVKAEESFSEEMPDSNLVFLIDVSGSMSSSDKLELLKTSMLDLVDNLPGNSTISIVTYASREELLLDGVGIKDKKKIEKVIRSLSAGGATAGQRGMEMAYEVAKENFIEGGNNRIIMATDGDLNVGISDPDELERFIEEKKNDGIFLSVLGFGTGNLKDASLERLADCGNGNYSYIDSKLEGHKVLVDEMSSTLVTVAKDVKFQMEFNPAKVNAYRLIGYQNRTMDAMDFADDTKDGGELGSGHTVVALYEIVPTGSKSAINLKYQNNDTDANVSTDYGTLALRYKEPDGNKSKLEEYIIGSKLYTDTPSDSFKFAGCAVEFAMILENSEHVGDATLDDILDTLKTIDETDEYKDEFRYLVRRMAKDA